MIKRFVEGVSKYRILKNNLKALNKKSSTFLFKAFLIINKMNELIKVTTNAQNEQLVSARELHQFLIKDAKGGQIGQDFTHWIKDKIDYGFEMGSDYITIGYDYLGNIVEENGVARNSESDNQLVIHKRDYILKLDMAKEIAMLQKNDKGKEARQYFIECEKKLRQGFELPRTFSEALMLAAKQAEIIENQNAKIELDAPKVEFYDEIIDAKETFDIAETAKLLKLKYGRNTLFVKLKEAGVLMNDNEPYQKYIGNFFIVVETKWNNPNTGTSHVLKQTRTTQRGLDWLQRNREKFKLN